jgi:hypothetical protein
MNVDLDALAHEFNMDIDEALPAVEDITPEALIADRLSDPDLVISTNINKANAILDRVIEEINRSGMSPRLGEVAGQLIATINQAVSQIYTKEFDMSGLRIKHKMLLLKEREVRLKELTTIPSGQGNTVNQNIIVTDRETVLRLLKDNKSQIKQIEDVKKGENNGN